MGQNLLLVPLCLCCSSLVAGAGCLAHALPGTCSADVRGSLRGPLLGARVGVSKVRVMQAVWFTQTLCVAADAQATGLPWI